MAARKERIRTTCPRDCYDSCGITVIKENGAVRKVSGDRQHPVSRGSLCGKCALAYNGAWLDPARRLLHPLRRVGPKGEGRFERVSWEDALSGIAGRLQEILSRHPSRSILHTHYTGTCSLIAGAFPLRFFHRLGATEVDPDTVCNNAGHQALEYVFGTSLSGFDPRTAKDTSCILVWGANPSSSAPHVHKHWLAEAPGRTVVIDPIAHPTARGADLFLQLRPGSDAALAFAMLNVIQRKGLVAEEFLRNHVVGWEEVEPLISACTPEWGEQRTEVPASKIEAAAEIYAQGPSLMWLGQGMQRQPLGGNAFRAAAMLCAATGNIGKPGAGILYLNGANTRGIDGTYVSAPHLGPEEKASISHMDLAERLGAAPSSRALFCWNNNIVASNPNQTRLREALRREDLLHVVVDLFPTDTADFADYVLPASSFFEFDDLLMPYFNNSISAQVQVMDRMGECLPNQEIFRRLAGAMGFAEPELFESDRDVIAKLLAQAGYADGFASLAGKGTVEAFREPSIQFPTLEFPTPSGKIEIASRRAETDGHPRVPQPHADEPTAGGRLRVLSPASEWQLNSSYGNDSKIRARLGPPEVSIHPSEAEARGLADGAQVQLVNDEGRLSLIVRVSEDVPRRVALVYKGRWPKFEASLANVNVINPGGKTDMGESSCVHAVEAELRRP